MESQNLELFGSKVKARGEPGDIEGILAAVNTLIDPDMASFKLSFGEWSKYWVKIEFKRRET